MKIRFKVNLEQDVQKVPKEISRGTFLKRCNALSEEAQKKIPNETLRNSSFIQTFRKFFRIFSRKDLWHCV